MSQIKEKLIVAGLSMMLTTTTVFASDFEQHWAKNAIDKWSNSGMVMGYEDGTFRPNQTVTRAEFAAIISRVFNLSETVGAPGYMELLENPNKWYVAPVQKVTTLGLMHIEGTAFKPDQAITREEAAYAITKAYELSLEGKQAKAFTDETLMANWSKDAINSLASEHYISGNPDGSFKPQSTLTRAELVTMLDQITPNLLIKPGTYTESLKGNVVINTKDIILKNMTIEGNLYLTQGIEKNQVVLDHVTVKGTVFINGGEVTMSGQYGKVQLSTGLPLHMTQGKIESLIVNKASSSLKVENEATIGEIKQNQPITIVKNEAILQQPIVPTEVIISSGAVTQAKEIKIESAGVYVNDQYVDLPISGNTITLNVQALSNQFDRSDVLSGLVIKTNLNNAKLSSEWGSMQSGKVYTFKQAEKELGMIKEIAMEAGVSPTLVVNYVLGGSQITIGGMLDDYQTAQEKAAELGIGLSDQYTFQRTLSHAEGQETNFNIELYLK